MVRKSNLSLAIFGVLLLLAACGDDVTKVTSEVSGMEIIASADSLGKCSMERSGEMKFAQNENAVYVCADSAWQNVSAASKDGTSCTVELLADSSGYKVICGGDSVGVVLNGKDGADGEKGEKGESCSFTDNGDGTILQVCGKDSVTLYKAFCAGDTLVSLCGGKVYDLTQSFCYKDSVYAFCGGKTFDPSKDFCAGDTLVSLCDGRVYDLMQNFCYEDSIYAFCNGKRFDPAKDFCADDALVALCGGNTYNSQNETCKNGVVHGFVTDIRDSQVYKTVQIGTQTWMAENLKYAYMPDTSSFCYNNSADFCAKYGRLYTWAAAMDTLTTGCGYGKTCSPTYPVRGICPEGWHLPSNAEWDILENFVAKQIGNTDSIGYALKSSSGWKNDGNGSDFFGFAALPAGAGIHADNEEFLLILEDAYLWTSVEMKTDLKFCLIRILSFYSPYISYPSGNKSAALSVRCLKD